MARPVSNKTNVNTETTKTDDQTKEQMQQQIDELKAMVEALLQQNIAKTETTPTEQVSTNLYESAEDRLEIDPKQYVRIMSLVNGGLNLIITHGAPPIRLEDFGMSRRITFDDLRSIVNNHPKAAKEGMFLIQDEKAVKALYLEKEYEKLLNKDVIDNITDLPNSEIKHIFETTTNTLKQTIVERVIEGIIEGDDRYQDRNKIKFIGDLVGKNLYDYVKEIEDNEAK